MIGIIGASCGTMSNPNPDVFDNPQAYLGQKIRVCGEAIDGSNLIQVTNGFNDDAHKGFVLTGNRSLSDRQKRGKLCVEGLVVFIGCNTEGIICVDAAYNYGIEVQ